jgi:tRNA threonylcarbamoyladenosine biosynthesis protein TsaE
MNHVLIPNLAELGNAARQIVQWIGNNRIICFYGSMGAGKTTLIKAICTELCVTDVVASPTFALVNEYSDGQGEPVFHFDFYRIKKLDEVFDFGYEEYFYNPEGICLIEWPELIEDILPPAGVVRVTIEVLADESRKVSVDIANGEKN